MSDQNYDFKTVSAKVTQAEFSRFKDYCKKKGLKPSSQLKELIRNEIDNPVPVNLAGKNIFLYNKAKDNFGWRVMMDNGERVEVENNLSAEFVSQLFKSMKKAVDERNVYLKKNSKESVAVPSKLMRNKKW